MTPGLRRALRWTKRIVLGLVTLVVLALAVAVGLVHTDWGRDRIRAEIVAALQAEFPGSTIRSLGGSPFGTLVLRGVTLTASDGKPVATIDKLEVSVQLRPLLHERVRVDTLAVTDVAVFVREQPPRAEQPTTANAASEPSTWTIELPAIEVTNARVTIEGEQAPEIFDQIAARASVFLPAGAPLSASATVRGIWRGKPIAARAHASVGADSTIRIPLASASVGDASVVAAGISIADRSFTGTVRAFAPAALVTELAGLPPPGDLQLVAQARGNGAITFATAVGDARAWGDVVADVETLAARGVITAELPELAALGVGELAGAGSMVAAVAADRERVRGIVTIRGTAEGADAVVTAAVDATRTNAQLVASLDGTYQGARASAAVAARGPLLPEPHLRVTGTADVRAYRAGDVALARAQLAVDGTVAPDRQQLSTRVEAVGIRSGTTRIPAATVEANVAHADGTIHIALADHRVRTQDGRVWAGNGGRGTVTDEAFVIEDVRTGTAGGTIVASARAGRLDGTLKANIRARHVSLAIADPTVKGTADADIDVAQRRGRWRGTASVRARGLSLPDRPTVDASVDIKLAGRTLRATGSVENPQLGRATVAAAVTTPRDVTNANAWLALPRSAVEQLTVTIPKLDAAPLGVAGTIDGELDLGATDARGTLHVRGVTTAHGAIDADITLAPGDGGAIEVHATGQTAGLPPAVADASFVVPARPFDPRAWKLLGRQTLRSAAIVVSGLHVDPALCSRFGVESSYSADVQANITIGAGAASAAVAVDVTQLRGGKLTVPVDVQLRADTDGTGSRATLHATSGKLAVDVDATTSLTVDDALAGRALTTPIAVTATVPDIAARDLLALLGETDVLAGTVGGKVVIAGTVAAPTIRAQLAAHGLALEPSKLTNRKPPTLDKLELDARWSGDHAELTLVGQEGADRLIKIAASGNPRDLRSIVGSIEAANFDLAPLAALGTGPLRAARGTLSAALRIRGLDQQTGSIRGQLAIKDARLPLTPELGTLRRASLQLDIVNQRIEATFDGRLGAGGGSISGTLTSNLVGGMPTDAHLEAKLNKVSPIGAMQPQIDATLVGNWANQDWVWTGSLAVRNGKIYVPPATGNDLLLIGAPSDMIFIDRQKLVKKAKRLQTKPWFVTRIAIGNTDIDVDDVDFRVRVVARGELMLEVGDGYSLRGQIATTKGTLDMVGRRYRIEQALLDFDDGTTDPRLDIRVTHEFKNLTLTAEVHGRASNPSPRLTGDPGTYTEGQLLSFFLGAEPSDQSSTAQQSEAVVGGGLAILSGRVGRRVNQYLPVKFDQINYEAETAASSKAIRFGMRLGKKSYLVWRQHVAPRPDENAGEAVFEYQFRPDFLFEGTIGERSKGGDFLWRKRW